MTAHHIPTIMSVPAIPGLTYNVPIPRFKGAPDEEWPPILEAIENFCTIQALAEAPKVAYFNGIFLPHGSAAWTHVYNARAVSDRDTSDKIIDILTDQYDNPARRQQKNDQAERDLASLTFRPPGRETESVPEFRAHVDRIMRQLNIVDAASQAREYRRMFERGSPAMSLSFLKRLPDSNVTMALIDNEVMRYLRIHELSGTVLGPYGNPKNPKKAVTDDDFVVPAAVAPTSVKVETTVSPTPPPVSRGRWIPTHARQLPVRPGTFHRAPPPTAAAITEQAALMSLGDEDDNGQYDVDDDSEATSYLSDSRYNRSAPPRSQLYEPPPRKCTYRFAETGRVCDAEDHTYKDHMDYYHLGGKIASIADAHRHDEELARTSRKPSTPSSSGKA